MLLKILQCTKELLPGNEELFGPNIKSAQLEKPCLWKHGFYNMQGGYLQGSFVFLLNSRAAIAQKQKADTSSAANPVLIRRGVFPMGACLCFAVAQENGSHMCTAASWEREKLRQRIQTYASWLRRGRRGCSCKQTPLNLFTFGCRRCGVRLGNAETKPPAKTQ